MMKVQEESQLQKRIGPKSDFPHGTANFKRAKHGDALCHGVCGCRPSRQLLLVVRKETSVHLVPRGWWRQTRSALSFCCLGPSGTRAKYRSVLAIVLFRPCPENGGKRQTMFCCGSSSSSPQRLSIEIRAGCTTCIASIHWTKLLL